MTKVVTGRLHVIVSEYLRYLFSYLEADRSVLLTLHLLVSTADKLCKQFGL